MATEKRLIDAIPIEAAIPISIGHIGRGTSDWQRGYCDGLAAVLEIVESSPTVDAVEVVHGEWLEDYETFVNDNGYESEPIQTGYICSQCYQDGFPNWHYCPNCGAKMDGDVNG